MKELKDILSKYISDPIMVDKAMVEVTNCIGIRIPDSEREKMEMREFLTEAKEHKKNKRKLDSVKCIRYAYPYLDLVSAIHFYDNKLDNLNIEDVCKS